jgi:hypothetical protein
LGVAPTAAPYRLYRNLSFLEILGPKWLLLVAVAAEIVASVQSACSIALVWSRQYLPPMLDIWVDLLRKADLLHSVRSMSAYSSVKPQQGCVVRPMPKNTPQNARWIGGSFPKMLFETNDTRLRRCGFTPVLLRSNKPVFRLQAERTFCDQSIVGDAEALIRCSGYHDRDRNHYNEVNLSPLSPVVSHQSLLPSEL